MIAGEQLYPLLLEPVEKPAIWGGDALVTKYGKTGDPHVALGESWECWDANRIANGAFSGSTLGDVRRELGPQLMGELDPSQVFPVLTKIIDARQPLSVQVHPDDAYARRVEHQPNGKTECWYVLAAQPGAQLILGWSRDTGRAEYERRVADGSLADILRSVSVCAGEVYYLPAGTLHAIGAGIEIFEAQQASDLTYRIFDWNRTGPDGQARELHVAKAADVLDFHATLPHAVRPLVVQDGGLERTLLVADPRFLLEHVRTPRGLAELQPSANPLTLTALAAPVAIDTANARIEIAPFATAVLPAALGAVNVHGEFLAVRPQPALASLRVAARANGIASADLDRFFAQFSADLRAPAAGGLHAAVDVDAGADGQQTRER